MRLIKGSKIQTGNGIYKCVGVWTGKDFEHDSYELMKQFLEPQPTDCVLVSKQLMDERIKSGQVVFL